MKRPRVSFGYNDDNSEGLAMTGIVVEGFAVHRQPALSLRAEPAERSNLPEKEKTASLPKTPLAMIAAAKNGSMHNPQPALSLRVEPAERSNLIIKYGIASAKTASQ
jgi:hypothetical protein